MGQVLLGAAKRRAERKLCYVLPSYDAASDQHFAHVPRLLEELGRHVRVGLIIEQAKGRPQLANVADIHAQRFGLGHWPLRCLEMACLGVRMRLKGYRKFFVRISSVAALPLVLVTRLTGAQLYVWRSGQGKEMLPGWELSRAALRDKLLNQLPFQLTARLAHRFVTGPESMAGYFTREWGIPERKIMILYNDVDLSRFRPDPSARGGLRGELGIPEEAPMVLCVHRLSPVRRTLHYFPRLFTQVLRERAETRFVVVGGGPEEAELRRAVRESGVEGRVLLTGSVSNRQVMRFYQAADLFIMPSWAEGFPRVLLEAMASGLAVVATDAGGTLDIVGERQRRYVVPRQDVGLLARRVVELLADEAERAALAAENLERVRRYSVESVARMYVERLFGAA